MTSKNLEENSCKLSINLEYSFRRLSYVLATDNDASELECSTSTTETVESSASEKKTTKAKLVESETTKYVYTIEILCVGNTFAERKGSVQV